MNRFVSRTHHAAWLNGLVYLGLTLALYHSTLDRLVTHDWVIEDYSSSALIPLVVLYLVWEKRDLLARTPSAPSWLGMVPVLVGLLLFWLGELSGEYFSQYLSLWLVLVGALWLHLGWRKLRLIAFPLLFGLGSFPLPNYLNTQLSLKLKLISSQLGVWLLHLFGMSAFREGNVIDLGFTRLQVVDACSGIRYLIPLIAMGGLLAYYYKGAFWKRGVVLFSTVPVAVLTNGVRIALVGMLYPLVGPKIVDGFLHDLTGWVIFMLSLLLLLLEIAVLKRVAPDPRREGTGREPAPATLPVAAPAPLFSPRFLAVTVLIAANLVLLNGVEIRAEIPAARPLSQFPLTLGPWQGQRGVLEPEVLDSLKLTDYATIQYHRGEESPVSFYAAYYSCQSKGTSVHSPATCLPGSGWNFEDSGVTRVSLAGGGREIPISRAFMEKSGQRELTYYWFPQRGRIVTNLFQLKLYVLLDGLTKRRTDGALVRLITPVSPAERVEDAEARLNAFVREVVPLLDRYLPGRNA
ncbi:VPLPA-CTERM-specific exosortase XrtD [Geomesophilobacter sediminis]|uniref:VPLPA-CTERM-specific exosortase XrtD n=1 Tax=Geomesophilobacter sediminis TaxID=2798584 RepID=A0A8J7JIH0_9BACT|nr:VPLPA-CTERM-specific exosortase XrtD [Geomesophilobacter sediminis]MBJ6724245.1 VPLPA-CTERM-specific exosortase XrtD [Geomesophilobacter sediminis]